MFRNSFLMFAYVLMCTFVFAEDKAVYYTPDRVLAARENVQKYDWAKSIEKRIFDGDVIKYYCGAEYAPAKKLVDKSDDFIWMLQPTTKIPRIFPHDTRGTCPNCGDAARNISFWCPWEIDPFEHPYKIKCKNCGKWFPSNDYQNGDMTSGDYPDDGNGILVNGKRYYMLREYADYVYLAYVGPALTSLSQAYLLTGDKRYARKGSILLARLASEYPNYEDRFDRTYCGAYGGTHPHYKWKKGGMITDLIWENFYVVKTALAYDALKEYMDQDPDMMEFLRGKGLSVKNGDDLRLFIKESIFRPQMKALLKGMIKGNEGLYQTSALAVAMAINDHSDIHPNTKDMVDFAYFGEGHLAYVIDNILWPDGGGHESPGYNELKLKYVDASEFMEITRSHNPGKYPVEKYPAIWSGPKGNKIFDYFMDLLVCHFAIPAIGDCGTAYPNIDVSKTAIRKSVTVPLIYYFFAATKFNNPRYAAACFNDEGKSVVGDLWTKYPEEKLRRLASEARDLRSPDARLLDFYGAAILESGKWPDMTALSLNYSWLKNHWQADALNLGLYGFRHDLLPDIGYPVSWDYTRRWDAHNMAHNTVTVDESFQRGGRGMSRVVVSAKDFKVIAASHDPYPGSSRSKEHFPASDLFERIDIMSTVGENSYIIDIFSVNGGSQHDQSWHSMPVPVTIPALDWSIQEKGTLAGEGVAQFGTWKDKWGRTRNDFPSFLTNVRKAPLKKESSWVWETGLPSGEALKMYIVPLSNDLQALMAKGRSPVWPKGKSVDYLLLRRENTNGQATVFLTILEPYKKKAFIKGISVKSVSPLVVNVAFENGNDEFTINIPDGPSRTTALRPIGIRKTSFRNGKNVGDVRIGASYITGRIEKVDYEKNRIAISMQPENIKNFAKGRYLRIYNDKCSASYRIEDIRAEDGLLWLSLDNSALLLRGTIDKVTQNSLHINSYFSLADPDGMQYAGVYVDDPENGAKRRLSKVFPDGTLVLPDGLSEAVRSKYLGALVSVWQYAEGDSVELSVIEDISDNRQVGGN